MSHLLRARRARLLRSGARDPRRAAHAPPGRDRALGQEALDVSRGPPRRARARAPLRSRHAVQGPSGEDSRGDPPRHRRAARSSSCTRRAASAFAFRRPFEGVIGLLEKRYKEAPIEAAREEYGAYRSSKPCPTCGGARLRRETESVKIGGLSLSALSRLSIEEAARFFATLDFEGDRKEIARRLVDEVRARLGFLLEVGLEYLDARSLGGVAVGRGRAAPAPRDADRLEPRRRALRARRAVGRSSSTRQPPASPGAREAPRHRQHGRRRRARPRHDPRRGLDRRHGAGSRRARRRGAVHRSGPRARERAALGDGRVSLGPEDDRAPGEPALGRGLVAPPRRCAHEQPEERHARGSARHVRGRHRRLGLGEELARPRHARARARPEARPGQGARRRVRRARGLAVPRQGRRHGSVADRAHAAVESGDVHGPLRADPRALRADAGSAPSWIRTRAVLVQREGRALRSVPRRRRAADRDAFPPRRVRHMRGVPRPALRPRHAGDPLQGPQHRRGAGSLGRRTRGKCSRACPR